VLYVLLLLHFRVRGGVEGEGGRPLCLLFFFVCVGIVGVDKFGVDRWIQCLGGPPATLARGRVTHFSLVVSGTVGMASVLV